METQVELKGISSAIQWPCVYISGEEFESCIELSLSDDNYIGYAYGELGINLFLPEEVIYDEIAVEIASLWVFLFES